MWMTWSRADINHVMWKIIIMWLKFVPSLSLCLMKKILVSGMWSRESVNAEYSWSHLASPVHSRVTEMRALQRAVTWPTCLPPGNDPGMSHHQARRWQSLLAFCLPETTPQSGVFFPQYVYFHVKTGKGEACQNWSFHRASKNKIEQFPLVLKEY